MGNEAAADGAIAASVILVTHDNYDSIRLTMSYVAAQTVAKSLEVIVAAPSKKTLNLVDSDMRAFHSYKIVEVGNFIYRGRAAGPAVRAAQGPIVLITENHAFPEPEWAEALIRAHEGPWAGVCPVVEIFNPTTLVSRAERFVDYGIWIARREPQEIPRLPWHNTSYKRDVLMQFADELEDLMEPEERLQERIKAQGHRFFIEPRACVYHVSDSKIANAFNAMFGRGRMFAASRSRNWSFPRKLLYVAASPSYPFIRLYQIREHYRRFNREYPVLLLIPTALMLLSFIALGECAGYLAGDGGTADWMARHELEIELRANPKEIEEMRSLLQKRLAAMA